MDSEVNNGEYLPVRKIKRRTVKLWNSLDPALKLKQNLMDFKQCLKKSLL